MNQTSCLSTKVCGSYDALFQEIYETNIKSRIFYKVFSNPNPNPNPLKSTGGASLVVTIAKPFLNELNSLKTAEKQCSWSSVLTGIANYFDLKGGMSYSYSNEN